MPVCAACAATNDEGSAFCEECGDALSASCPSCGAAVKPGKKFCRSCGTPLAASEPQAALTSATSSGASAARSTPVAERRVCSVLFCDLVGFTPLSEARDPEEVRELLSRYFAAARTVITRYGGVVEKFIGDAVMAVWGTPTATELDAERAVRAALDVVAAVATLGREAGAPGLAARGGVVTGPVAVTVGAAGEGMVAGDAVNTAARVQAAADPGSVLVDEATRRVAEAAVGFTSVGEHGLKGKAEPVQLWRADRVLAGVGGSQRIDGLEAAFVGRDAELRLVKELFHACADRRAPRLVSVTGVAGVGKSRLGWEFEKYVDGLADTVYWHRGRCLSYGEGVAFWGLAEMVRQRLQIAEEDSTDVAAGKLTAGLDRWLTDPAERAYVGPRLGQLLGAEYGEAGPVLGREELFAGWRLFFERLAAAAPVVMVVEDLHHADAGLLDFLEHVLDWARGVPIFVLTLARPELEGRRPGWGAGRRNSTTLTLDPLDDASMSALLDGLVPHMPDQAKQAIADRAEGIPLYAVETIRMLIDRDVVQPTGGVYKLVGDVGQLTVPATLQSLLAARLDALEPDARALVADAAVLGATFPAEALISISDSPDDQVRRLLAELVRREVLGVRADPLSPQRGHYGFVQTMFRQVAYDTLSRRERKARHLAVANHLQTTFADQGEEISEVIAAHLLDALAAVPDDPDAPQLRTQAVTMLTRAGERAERTGAPATAAASYQKAAEILQQDVKTDSQLRSAELLERAGKAAEFRNLGTAIELYQKAADLYRHHGRGRAAARCLTGIGRSLRSLGKHEEARNTLLEALTVLEPEPDADTIDGFAALASLEIFAGNLDEGDRLSSAALTQAQALGVSDAVLATLLVTRGLLHVFADRTAQAGMYYQEAVRRAESAQSSFGTFRARSNLADVLMTSDPHAAAQVARAALEDGRRIGHQTMWHVGMNNLLQALLLTGDWDDLVEALEHATTEVGAMKEPWIIAMIMLLQAFRGDRLGVLARRPALAGLEETEDPQELAQRAIASSLLAAAEGNTAESLTRAESSLSYTEAVGLSSEALRFGWPLAADAALALGDHAKAGELLDWLDQHPPGHIPALTRADAQRIRARLLAAMSDPAAADAFDAATQDLRRARSPYHLAVGLVDQAEYLVSQDQPEVARELAEEAGTIAERLRATPLLERATALVADSVGATPHAISSATG